MQISGRFAFMFLISSCTLLFLLYGLLILYYWQSWKSIPGFIPGNRLPATKISVIVPARNEQENIGSLLQALQEQTYPAALFEVIVVDDHSTDETVIVAQKFPGVILIQLITTGAAISTDFFSSLKAAIVFNQPGEGKQSASVVRIKSPVAAAIPVSMAFFL